MPDDTWEAGQLVADRYRLEIRLGAGGMGEVWRAEHLLLRSPVALKLVRPDDPLANEICTRLLREARAAAALRSPHVVQILDYGLHAGSVPYIAMEYLEGDTLAERLERRRRLTLPEVCRIVTHISRALTRAHEAGIVHRDMKPDNVFLVRNDDEEIAKVLDFGIAKVTKRLSHGVTEATRVGTLLGSPNYMSPEQAKGDLPVDHRTDLWSLALIAFECATGRMAFTGEILGELLVEIVRGEMPVPSKVHPLPAAFDAWFAKSASRDPEARFQTAKEMAERLRDLLAPSDAPPRSSVRRPTPFAGLVAMTKRPTGTYPATPAPTPSRPPAPPSVPPRAVSGNTASSPPLPFAPRPSRRDGKEKK